MRKLALITISMLLGFLVPLAGAEVLLRFLPVGDGLHAMPVNATSPIFHFTPNREATWSLGWRFDVVNHVHVNNEGFVNDQDYASADPRPLLAVVGDSYIEARMVPYRETLQGRLATTVAPDLRVYSFGASGAPLSQYLVWAREARLRWKAQALVIVVVGNDFDESLAIYRKGEGFHHYVEQSDGSLLLERFDYAPGIIRRLFQMSTLARYLVWNLGMLRRASELIDRLFPAANADPLPAYIGNTAARANVERLERSKRAVKAFLADLVGYSGWSPDRVVLVVDGVRYPVYAAELERSYFGTMRNYFMERASRAGFEVIDMDRLFFARYQAAPVQFEVPGDGHWNGTAHGIAAGAVAASTTFRRWHETALER